MGTSPQRGGMCSCGGTAGTAQAAGEAELMALALGLVQGHGDDIRIAQSYHDFGSLIPVSKGASKEAGALFIRPWSDRERGNGLRLKKGSIRWDIGKKFFPVRVEMPWHSVAVPGSVQGEIGWGLEQPEMLEGVPVLSGGLELNDVESPSNPDHSMIL